MSITFYGLQYEVWWTLNPTLTELAKDYMGLLGLVNDDTEPPSPKVE